MDSATAARVRRKRRPISACPNSLFVKWVEEWRDEAREKGSKCQYSYNKAINSIKKYPLPLSSGQEAKILDYVGEKLAQMLDKRLAEHLASGGTLEYSSENTAAGSSSGGEKSRDGSDGKKTRKKPPSSTSLPHLPLSPSSHPSQQTHTPSSKKTPRRRKPPDSGGPEGSGKTKRKKTPREYIPVYRTGPYAILIALYKAEQRPSYCGYLTKSQLISEAQPYCDTSFTVPDAGSYYTSWSSTSSVIKRGLVTKTSHPPRFSLTDTGVTLAIRLLQGSAVAENQHTTSLSPIDAPTSSTSRAFTSPSPPKSPPMTRRSSSPIVLGTSPPSSPHSGDTEPYHLSDIDGDGRSERDGAPEKQYSHSFALRPHRQLQFWYINPDGKHVHNKDSAAVTFNEMVSVGFLIKCRQSALESSGLRYSVDNCRRPDSQCYVYAYLCNGDAPDVCSPPEDDASSTTSNSRRETDRTVLIPPPPVRLRSGSPITLLSESEDSGSSSDVEVVPLADRIGLRGRPSVDENKSKSIVVGADRHSSQNTFSSLNASNRNITRNSLSSSDAATVSSKKGQSSDAECLGERLGGGGGVEGSLLCGSSGLTPAKAAGLAALRRLEASSSKTRSAHCTPPSMEIPVYDLTDEESDVSWVERRPVDGYSSHCGQKDKNRKGSLSAQTTAVCDSENSVHGSTCSSLHPKQKPSERPSKGARTNISSCEGSTKETAPSRTYSKPPSNPPTQQKSSEKPSQSSKTSLSHKHSAMETATSSIHQQSSSRLNPPTTHRGNSESSTHTCSSSKAGGSRGAVTQSFGGSSSTLLTTSEAPRTSTLLTTSEAPRTSTPLTTSEAPRTSTPLTTSEAPRTSTPLTTSEAPRTSTKSSADDSIDLSNPEFVLKPGEFEVVLYVDNSESTASRKSSSQFRGLLLQDLGKNGVKFDVRKLNVGDFVWVAREKVSPLPGLLSLPASREVVLEYIVERKRMDDLAGSIIDGRFHEQKFRLGQCGVCHPVYLVEEFGDVTHLKPGPRALEQAITNTQIINGFFVKRTKDIRESISYLTIMTRFLQQHYTDKTIKAYPWETVVQLNKRGAHQKGPYVVHSMAFSKFNEASIKNKVLTVYEMFGRQLMQVSLLSADKAMAILEKYPTISHLREAYRQCHTDSERETLLSDIRAGQTKRKLGPALSHMLYSLYWKDSS